jgi:hypothetical protein
VDAEATAPDYGNVDRVAFVAVLLLEQVQQVLVSWLQGLK